MQQVLETSPAIRQLVENRWVQLALLAPQANRLWLYQRGRFLPYRPETTDLPVVASSLDWYRGWREHLGYARIANQPTAAQAQEDG
jgi:hypothetical protein